MSSDHPLAVEQLTATGRGAVAVIRVSSPLHSVNDSLAIYRSSKGISPRDMRPGEIRYGHWRDEDVVLIRVDHDHWEIHCHGGTAAVSRILDDLDAAGAAASQGAQSLHEALSDLLLQTSTLRTARLMLAQRQGVLEDFLRELLEIKSTEDLAAATRSFLEQQRFAAHLTRPWCVAIVGQPNAGKSSLLNAIVGYDRSIVFEEAGTTRDRVEADTVVDGWPVRLIDTAGVRDAAADEIEGRGIGMSLDSISSADAVLVVVDACQGWQPEDLALRNSIPQQTPVLVVWNKTDIGKQNPASRFPSLVRTAIPEGTGIGEVISWMTQAFVPREPALTDPLPVVPEINDAIETSLASGDLEPFHAALQRWLPDFDS